MTASSVRWGVLSTANIGRAAVNPAIQRSSNGELVAVASRDGELAKRFAKDHGIPGHYGSYQALLDAPDIDAVYIPLPNSMHLEWAVKAAQVGKHVLCEKPLALDVAECNEMIAAAEDAGVILMEAFMYRFHPRFEHAQSLIEGGAIGELRTVRSAFTFNLTNPSNIRFDASLGGGSLMDVGCYCVNVIRTLAGAEPVRAQASANWTDSGVDGHMAGILRFENGILGHFDSSLTMERREFFEAAGTEGTLIVDDAFVPGTRDVTIVESHGRNGTEEHVSQGTDEYQHMVEHFADCVTTGRAPRHTAQEAAANMATIQALY
ncbi:MAG: Gfo/Idh/MocA family protein, partial [Longimicrobiales bacterium]